MTPTDDKPQDDLEPLGELQPLDESAASGDAAASADDGRWVWQYGAPPPPPSFGAQFFGVGAQPEYLRFAFCAILVILGALLPWGPQMAEVATGELNADGIAVMAEQAVVPPTHGGLSSPINIISLMLGLWLLYNACAGAYTRGARFNPWAALFMLEPLMVAAMALSAAMDEAGEAGFGRALEIAGPGAVLTLAGSGFVVLLFFLLIGKIVTTKDDKSSGRRSSGKGAAKGGKAKAGGDAKKGKRKGKDAKAGKDKKGKDKSGDDASADSAPEAGDAGAADAAKS